MEVVLDNGKKIEKTTAELLPNDKISKLNTIVCEHGTRELPLAYEKWILYWRWNIKITPLGKFHYILRKRKSY